MFTNLPNRLVSIYAKSHFQLSKTLIGDQKRRTKHTSLLPVFQRIQNDHSSTSTRKNLSQPKPEDKPDDYLYPMVRHLNMTTTGTDHQMMVSSSTILKYIKLGAINDNIASQYCHYLASIIKDSDSESKEVFSSHCLELTRFLAKKNLAKAARQDLFSHIVQIDAKCCDHIVGNYLIDQEEFSHYTASLQVQIMQSCYKYNLWDHADKLLNTEMSSGAYVIQNLFDPIIEQLNEITETNDEANIKRAVAHFFLMIRKANVLRAKFMTADVERLKRTLEALKFKLTVNPSIKYLGRCTACDKSITTYDDADTPKLHEGIKQLLEEKAKFQDVLVNTLERDLNQFKKKIEEITRDGKPIDCVIDALNVAHTLNDVYKTVVTHDKRVFKAKDTITLSQALCNAIIRNAMTKRFRKILLIGRKHMYRWPMLVDFLDKNGINYYFADRSSKDDLYILYASTLSPHTKLATNDFLRDHLHFVGDEYRLTLSRWIDTHQIWINRDNMMAIWPTYYETIPSIEPDESCFHIPAIDVNKLDLLGMHQPPPHLNNSLTTWLCCKVKE